MWNGEGAADTDHMPNVSDDELTEAIIDAGKAMAAIAARALDGEISDVTLPQYRTLVALCEAPSRLADLAVRLGVSPSTATRMCDRLVRKGLVTRTRDELDRREVNLAVTDTGRRIVSEVIARRRDQVSEVLSAIGDDVRDQLIKALHDLASRVGDSPEVHWAQGWHDGEPVRAGLVPSGPAAFTSGAG